MIELSAFALVATTPLISLDIFYRTVALLDRNYFALAGLFKNQTVDAIYLTAVLGQPSSWITQWNVANVIYQ